MPAHVYGLNALQQLREISMFGFSCDTHEMTSLSHSQLASLITRCWDSSMHLRPSFEQVTNELEQVIVDLEQAAGVIIDGNEDPVTPSADPTQQQKSPFAMAR